MLKSFSPFFKRHKFKALKVYSSTDWLLENKKNYRNVFDRYEVDYIYAEVSFYNKYFDVQEWAVPIQLKCYAQEDNGERVICTLNFTRKVSIDENIVYLREGWGNKELGAFWENGMYCWEAFIDGKSVATSFFFVQESGEEYPSPPSYLSLESVLLFEGDEQENSTEIPKAQSTFSKATTRYICSNLTFKNHLPHKEWFCEIIVRYYNTFRHLKGENKFLHRVKEADESIQLSSSWGANTPGHWFEGDYTIEIVFLDHLLAIIPFKVSNKTDQFDNVEIIKPDHYLERYTSNLKANKHAWIQQLAQADMANVIKELLEFAEKYRLDSLTKSVVNLSARAAKINHFEVLTETQKEELDTLNETLIDLIHQLKI